MFPVEYHVATLQLLLDHLGWLCTATNVKALLVSMMEVTRTGFEQSHSNHIVITWQSDSDHIAIMCQAHSNHVPIPSSAGRALQIAPAGRARLLRHAAAAQSRRRGTNGVSRAQPPPFPFGPAAWPPQLRGEAPLPFWRRTLQQPCV